MAPGEQNTSPPTPIVAVNDDEATIRSMYTVFQQTETLPMQAIIAGRYHDPFVESTVRGAWSSVATSPT